VLVNVYKKEGEKKKNEKKKTIIVVIEQAEKPVRKKEKNISNIKSVSFQK
jgi:hypothetical protein